MIMNTMTLLIKPVSWSCNLRCAYCFYLRVEDIYGEKKRSRMSEDVLEEMIRQALSVGRPHNAFIWQGGEPTLAGIDFFRKALELQRKYAGYSQQVQNFFQTNGILLDSEWCEFLAGNDWLTGISLDGPEDLHNRYRLTAGGTGTWKEVMESVERMKSAGVTFNALAMLNDQTVREPERVYRFFRKNRIDHLQFINCYEKDAGGNLLPFAARAEAVAGFYVRLFDLWMEDGFPHVSIRLFEDILIYYLDRVHVSCTWMGSCDSYLLVEHNGDLYPCDFFVEPRWRLGNLMEQPLQELEVSPLRQEFASLKKAPDECSSCPVLSFCNGDCIRYRDDDGGGWSARSYYSPVVTRLIKHMEPHLPRIREMVMDIRKGERPSPPGRNEPCPCGSGKKYKHCCGKK